MSARIIHENIDVLFHLYYLNNFPSLISLSPLVFSRTGIHRILSPPGEPNSRYQLRCGLFDGAENTITSHLLVAVKASFREYPGQSAWS